MRAVARAATFVARVFRRLTGVGLARTAAALSFTTALGIVPLFTVAVVYVARYPLFQQWLEAHFPDRAKRVMARLRDMRGGKENDAQFGSRMTGHGLWADLIRQRFTKAKQRLGMDGDRVELDLSQFQPPTRLATSRGSPGQASLF